MLLPFIIYSGYIISPRNIHRHGIGGKFDVERCVEIIYGFDQSYTADLKKIVGIFTSVYEALDYAENKLQIAVNKLLSRCIVSAVGTKEQIAFFFIAEKRQL